MLIPVVVLVVLMINGYKCEQRCGKLTESDLSNILGPAYNYRYMSIESPVTYDDTPSVGGKRRADSYYEFELDRIITQDEQPAWEIHDHVQFTNSLHQRQRLRRETDYMQEWHCKSTLIWTDLGPDYFPRYLRSVDCIAEYCWFKIYKCRARSFAVKILRRKKDRCVPVRPGSKIIKEGVPTELKELWVWEERPVNFCCECTLHG